MRIWNFTLNIHYKFVYNDVSKHKGSGMYSAQIYLLCNMFHLTTELLTCKIQLLTFSPVNKINDPEHNESVQHSWKWYFSTFTKKKNLVANKHDGIRMMHNFEYLNKYCHVPECTQ